PDAVLAALHSIIGPDADYQVKHRPEWWTTKPKVESDARGRLRSYFVWWRDPESKQNHSGRFYSHARALRTYYIVAVLLAVEVLVTEREWGRGHAPEFARGMMLLGLRRRQRGVKITATMRRILAQVIAERLGVYLMTTARAIIAQSAELQHAADERIKA